MSKSRKKNGFASEFKAFILRGNVIDLAVGVIIGGAFQKIVNSVVDDLVIPIVGLLLGKLDFNELSLTLASADGKKLSFNYGSFITSVINFLIMGFIIFLMIKGINRLRNITVGRKPEETDEPSVKDCPFCLSGINIAATRCPNCTSELTQTNE